MSLPKIVKYESMIDYKDGSEDILLNIVNSTGFDELLTWRRYSQNWPLYYHLAPHRKNIINWLDFGDEPIEILELGAGCGAITSGLVKNKNVKVTAVEGSLDRAKVIQQRCSHAENLEIHVCNINDFSIDKKYDIVTLIGVLEYSGRYSEEEDPFTWLLSFAEKLLKKDGILFLAIENKMGHKYLSGTSEDHYGRPWEGINNYPNYSGVRTFNYNELSDMINFVGLSEQQWYYPYPDYKLPGIVISDQAIKQNEFDWLPLFNIPGEPNMSKSPTFNEHMFLKSLDDLKCANKFMNSFCIIAGNSKTATERFVDSTFLAYKSTIKHRDPRYNVETIFKDNGSGNINVIKSFKGDDSCESKYIKHVVDSNPQKYFSFYTSIYDLLLDSLFSGDIKSVRKYFLLWEEILLKQSSPHQGDELNLFNEFSNETLGALIYEKNDQDLWISGKFLDLVPGNVLISENLNDYEFIDLEWQMQITVPTQLVFDRGMQIFNSNMIQKSKFLPSNLNSLSSLLKYLQFNTTSFNFLKNYDQESVTLFDNWFQGGVFNNRLDDVQDNVELLDFMDTIVEKIEQKRHLEAISYYDRYRKKIPPVPELDKFDELISGLKKKMINK